MAAPSEMTIAALNTKVLEVLTHIEAGEWSDALDDLDSADTIMTFLPDREFDGQRVEFRQKAEQLQNLRNQIRKKVTAGRGASQLTHIPVTRKLDSAD